MKRERDKMITKNQIQKSLHVLAVSLLLALPQQTLSQSEHKPSSITQVVLLGTGNPFPNTERSGPCTAVVVNGTPYLFDLGPGVVRRAMAAHQKGVKGLHYSNLRVAFITHLHSDHTVGYPDFIFTPWVVGRKGPLEVYGPKGVKAMTEHILAAWREDIKVRTEGMERNFPEHNDTGYRVNAHEVNPGVIYKDENVTVKAFLVPHGEWPQAFGYRNETPDRSIVISGDTGPAQSVIDNCDGCDVLIHEVYSQAGFAKSTPDWQRYRLKYHTSSKQLAELATKAKPKLLILYHQMYKEEDLVREMGEAYKGRF